jgi:hypothetical protein
LLEDRDPPKTLASFTVEDSQRRMADRGGIGGVAGQVTLVHRRTGRRTVHVYAAIHLGGLEVFGATRGADADRDPGVFSELAGAVTSGARVTTLIRLIADGFGPHEFGLDSALPDAAGEIVRSAAAQLADRFGATYERLYSDHRQLLVAFNTAGYPLPPELRAPAEFALARRFEAEIARAVDGTESDSFEAAQAIAREARQRGFQLATPSAAALMGRTLLTAVERAVDDPEQPRIAAALQLLRLTRQLGLTLDIDRSQELVLAALGDALSASPLRPLAGALGIRC